MKKALLLTSLATLAAVSFGCALTDYPATGVLNKSQGLIGCQTDDRRANTQQTVELQTRDLLLTSSFHQGGIPGGSCLTTGGFDPGVTLNNPDHQQARDWNRFDAAYIFLGEAQVFGSGPFAGTWMLGGVKDLDDGSRRIQSFYRPQTGAFSCVGSAVDGRYGGPEGVVIEGGLPDGRTPGLFPETIAIDSAPGLGWCQNIAAVAPERAASQYSTYWAFTGRSGEGRLAATPITRRAAAGLAPFLAGSPMTVNVKGVDITGSGAMNADGSITVSLLGMAANGQTYQAETPFRLTVRPDNNFRTVKVEFPNAAEASRLAEFALSANLTDQQISLAGDRKSVV